jgi:serine/threonine protein kinase
MSTKDYGDAIFKCIGIKESDAKVHGKRELIKSEFKVVQEHWLKKPDYFIETFEFFETVLILNPRTHKKINVSGEFLLIGFIMEKMENDLLKLLNLTKERKETFSDFQLFIYMEDLLEILAYLQSENLCHRDIKPENIFVDKFGKLKLGDFGTSKKVEFKNESIQNEINSYYQSKQQLHTVIGTRSYFAPEIFLAWKQKKEQTQYNPFKADLFSLGKTFLDLCLMTKVNLYDYYVNSTTYNKQLLFHLNKILFYPKLAKAIYIMMEFDPNKRHDLISFKQQVFNHIFSEEILRHEASREHHNEIEFIEEVTIISKEIKVEIKNQNHNFSGSDFDQIKVYFKDISFDEKAVKFEEFKEIEKKFLILYDKHDRSEFKQSGNEEKTFLVKSGRLFSTFLGQFNNIPVICTKFFFPSNDRLKKRFLNDLTFICNNVNSGNCAFLVKHFGVFHNYDTIYLVSEYLENAKEVEKSDQQKKMIKTKFYNLDYVFKTYNVERKFNDFFGKVQEENTEKVSTLLRVKILKQILIAFGFLKSKGVCFVNLSLKSILYDHKTNNIKLRNYGIFDVCFKHRYSEIAAKLFHEESGFFCWPPEFFNNYIDNNKSDLWALGICIHQLFSDATLPWNIITFNDYLIEVIFNESSTLSLRMFDPFNGLLEEIVRGLVVKDLEKRKDFKWVFDKLGMK